jgi:hypothetical protein
LSNSSFELAPNTLALAEQVAQVAPLLRADPREAIRPGSRARPRHRAARADRIQLPRSPHDAH